jgi:alpha-beta hydrolase superfamily lysophospholipase
VPETAFSLNTRPDIMIRGRMTDTGYGPIGLFLHGFRSHCVGEKATALTEHAFARGYSWARFDLAAHGASTGALVEQTLSGWLEDALSVAALYAPRPLILVGSSLGAWLAVLMARSRRIPVAGLVLLAPAFNFLQRYYAGLPQGLRQQWRSDGRLTLPDPYGPPGTVYQLGYPLIEDAVAHDVLSVPVALPCPLTMIHGDRDEVVPLAVSEDFLRHVHAPDKRLTVVAGGDHRLTAAIPRVLAEVDALWPVTAVRAGRSA